MMIQRSVGSVVLGTMLLPIGCALPAAQPGDPQTRQSLTLLMPEEIGIMPFTRIESFDDDDRPDGIALLLRPINMLGDPVNIVGGVRAELFEFVPASAQPQGQRLAMWEMSLNTKRDQLRYWNSTTQMYEFRLEFDADVVAQHDKYVLEVTYNTPLGTHLTDKYTLELPMARESFAADQPAPEG
ncbi:MAG: hypothetical protein JSV19_10855 [Phycisphaerales bacterium]|nr:MAG: hypothetical protein JSV19_10855 [Phycisphaerales bacterium]